MYRVGIDIGGTKVNIGLLKDREIVKTVKIPTAAAMRDCLSDVKAALQTLLADENLSFSDVTFFGIGVPGTVSRDGKTAVFVPNIGWENEPVAAVWKELTGAEARLVQDSRASALGEYKMGAGRGKKCVICVTLGTGIGTGIVMDGKIFDGVLGGAGELGHTPVKPDGRACGCGKQGCLEKYAAGLGLDITAKELFGDGADVRVLFDKAREGDELALKSIADAVVMLGNVLVCAVNLLSPDCLLFSGGLSRETELFVDPLIDYIKKHAYSLTVDGGLEIKKAELSENSPMAGAALLCEGESGGTAGEGDAAVQSSQSLCAAKGLQKSECACGCGNGNARAAGRAAASDGGKGAAGSFGKALPARLSASIMCADWLNLAEDIKKLEKNNIDFIHCDVMDGHFVPNMMIPPELIKHISSATSLPLDIHLMVDNPEKIVPMLKLRPCDIVSVHYETTHHILRALSVIKEMGGRTAVAINPATPIEVLRDILPDVEMVLIMTVNPGYAGQKLVEQTLDKVKRLKTAMAEWGYPDISVEVDGNCSFSNIPRMRDAGADTFVVGSSSLFDKTLGVDAAAQKLREIM